MVDFEKNIPLPKENRGSRKQKYEWGKMDINDSFSITKEQKVSIYGSVRYYNKKNGTSIKIKIGTDEKGEIRCWRVE